MARIVTDFIEENYKLFPEKELFADDKRSVKITEFRQESRSIAMAIAKGQFFKKPIAIYVDKSIECLCSFMGVAYSGNMYTPIDTSLPLSKVESIFAVLNPAAIISTRNHLEKIKSIQGKSSVLCYEDIVNEQCDEILLRRISDSIIDTDALYILFTSGSTGVPKGVVVSHRSVISYANWVTEAFEINSDSVLGNQTPFFFSMSVLDIFATIKSAAKMCIIPKILFSFPIRLLEYIKDKGINTIYWVPSALCQVANLKALGTRDVSCIKKVLFAGEVMPTKQLNMWIRELPDTLFANLFGPTEATDISNYYIVDRELSDDESVPIGKACKNTDLFILDEDDNEIKDNNVIGELCIRGITLAYGYYNNPKKTSEVFVQNPLNPCYSEIIYRTGDLVHINGYGELIYDGRKDFQIKHMGHRIELGEIETAASSFDGVDRACCVYDKSNKEIVLFYCGCKNNEEVRERVKERVPLYMVPSRVIKLNSMPCNQNGKIDRNRLIEEMGEKKPNE